jgi:hypothetical protein
MASRAMNPMVAATELLTAQSWRVTSGAPSAEEVAAIAAVLSAVLSERATADADDPRGTRRTGAPWRPSAVRRRAATSWAAGASPSWKNAA